MHLTGNPEIRPNPWAKLAGGLIGLWVSAGWTVSLAHRHAEIAGWVYPLVVGAVGIGLIVSAMRQLRARRAHGSRPSR